MTLRSLVALAIKILGALGSFLVLVTASRTLGFEAYGLFATALSAALLLAVIMNLGLPQYFLRVIGQAAEPDRHEISRNATIAVLGSCASLALAVAIAAAILGLTSSRMSLPLAIATVVLGGLTAASDGIASILRGNNVLARALVPREIVWRVLTILLFVAWSQVVGKPFSAAAALWIMAGILTAVLAVQVAWMRSVFGRGTSTSNRSTARPAIVAARWLWAGSVTQVGVQHLLVLVVSIFLDPISTAGFFTSMRIAVLLNFILVAVNLATAPRIARLIRAEELDRLQQMLTRAALLAVGPTAMTLTAILIIGDNVLALFDSRGPDYYWCLVILCSAQLGNAIFGQTGTVMNMSGMERALLLYTGVSYGLCLIGVALLPLDEGALVPAALYGIALVAWNAMAYLHVRRRLGVDCSVFAVLRGES